MTTKVKKKRALTAFITGFIFLVSMLSPSVVMADEIEVTNDPVVEETLVEEIQEEPEIDIEEGEDNEGDLDNDEGIETEEDLNDEEVDAEEDLDTEDDLDTEEDLDTEVDLDVEEDLDVDDDLDIEDDLDTEEELILLPEDIPMGIMSGGGPGAGDVFYVGSANKTPIDSPSFKLDGGHKIDNPSNGDSGTINIGDLSVDWQVSSDGKYLSWQAGQNTYIEKVYVKGAGGGGKDADKGFLYTYNEYFNSDNGLHGGLGGNGQIGGISHFAFLLKPYNPQPQEPYKVKVIKEWYNNGTGELLNEALYSDWEVVAGWEDENKEYNTKMINSSNPTMEINVPKGNTISIWEDEKFGYYGLGTGTYSENDLAEF